MEIKVGKCETCRFARISRYDPSPAGLSLASGYMEDCECEYPFTGDEDAELDTAWDDFYNNNKGECPFWEPNISYCKKHRAWYGGAFCPHCENEAWGEMEED